MPHQSTSPHRRTRLVAAFTAAVITLCGPPLLAWHTHHRAATAAPNTNPPAPPASSVSSDTHTLSSSASRCLHELASTLTAAPPAAPAEGRFLYRHLAWWVADDTLHTDKPATTTLLHFEEHRWRAHDGSGRIHIVNIPAAPSRPSITIDLAAGNQPPVLREPIPDNPTDLAAAITATTPDPGAQGITRAVADLHLTHDLHRDTRIAVLRMLAGLEGMHCEPHTVDRAGRDTIAVTINSDHDTVRNTLHLDPVSGELLAFEEHLLRNPPAMTAPTPRLRAYLLVLHRNRQQHLPHLTHKPSPTTAPYGRRAN